jgi:hypothetical protein
MTGGKAVGIGEVFVPVRTPSPLARGRPCGLRGTGRCDAGAAAVQAADPRDGNHPPLPRGPDRSRARRRAAPGSTRWRRGRGAAARVGPAISPAGSVASPGGASRRRRPEWRWPGRLSGRPSGATARPGTAGRTAAAGAAAPTGAGPPVAGGGPGSPARVGCVAAGAGGGRARRREGVPCGFVRRDWSRHRPVAAASGSRSADG